MSARTGRCEERHPDMPEQTCDLLPGHKGKHSSTDTITGGNVSWPDTPAGVEPEREYREVWKGEPQSASHRKPTSPPPANVHYEFRDGPNGTWHVYDWQGRTAPPVEQREQEGVPTEADMEFARARGYLARAERAEAALQAASEREEELKRRIKRLVEGDPDTRPSHPEEGGADA